MPRLDAEEMKEIDEMLKEAEEIMDEFEQKAAIRAKEMGEDKKVEPIEESKDAPIEKQEESAKGLRSYRRFQEESTNGLRSFRRFDESKK